MSTPTDAPNPSPAGDRTALARDLVAEWERQQEVYIAYRENRFALMVDLVELVARPADLGRPLRVLDLACGPGSATKRVLARFPDAEVVAIDLDPLLVELGRLDQAEATTGPTWLVGDLRDPAWVTQLPHTEYDAVISTTALHWLTGAELSDLYATVHGLLTPGGVFLNGDYLPARRPSGRVAELATEVGRMREERALTAGAQAWETWWERVRAVPELASEVAAHDAALGQRRENQAPSRAFHLEALREAGFSDVDLVWHDLTEGLVCALA
ncbi:class I SAM-dependent methyltransferase [Nocardioides sp. zg-536]|uniref:Class I SAM-dependent methyltransferase n=1 Tax=Nocardioides faecalis TaxID=2803858 RepID=A0A938Y6K5_9ACTN|nr:class I SAM-dependent methyltransferase [Nocardioides faecalis]MBM9460154.1 class I SAM-dependent methyltransferase [Nocardioides faecalis]QVI60051.1 class I SAM-dependent methyltransferase [Nocardioides faecalis]